MMSTTRRILAAALLALAVLPAHAQLRDKDGEPCTVPGIDYIRATELNTVGQWVYFYCVTRFEVLYSYRLLPAYAISQPWVFWAAAHELGLAPDVALQVPYVAEGEVATDALKADMLRAIVLDAHRPPAPRWVVGASAVSTTRPTYPYVDGVRGTVSNGRIAAGTQCDCATRSVAGSAVYCAVPPAAVGGGTAVGAIAPVRVAVCTAAPAPISAPPAAADTRVAPPEIAAATPAPQAPPPVFARAEPLRFEPPPAVIPPVVAPATAPLTAPAYDVDGRARNNPTSIGAHEYVEPRASRF